MTTIRLHGILGKEYENVFSMKIDNPSSVLSAIDCNRSGFIKRVIELQKQGLAYDIIVDKTRAIKPEDLNSSKNPETIDLVPVIVGSGPFASLFTFMFGGGVMGSFVGGLAFSAISYALAPKPEVQGVEATAQASRSSFVFGSPLNTASQGTPVPVGYGRLKVGSKVVQASVKSFPQNQQTQNVLTANAFLPEEEDYTTPNAILTSRIANNSTQE
jgi:predicted phage tail protein|tara:strand:+ start:3952 stop:4596 length:645 start_codon:yes stop_codon:yes gene_type:complete